MYKSKDNENISRTMQDKKKSETYSNYKDFRGDMQKSTIDDSTFTADSTKFKSGINPKYKLNMDESYDYNKINNPKATEFVDRMYPEIKAEQKKSGIYMDRMDGALPQNRVSKYYQDTNPKMEQVSGKQMVNDIKAVGSFVAGGGPIKDMISSSKVAYNKYLKPGVDKVVDAKNKTFGKNFFMDNVVGDVKSGISGVKKALKKD